MGFKTDTSFLRFLTMGAHGVHQTILQLQDKGFKPIELERYCASNKIWSTKVKRLRLPDLLCVKTGLRLEVRAKSDLKIRMSDAPNNPARAWDAGLQDDDLAAFIACFDDGEGPVAADEAMFFRIRDLRSTVEQSKLGPPKSASEGAERDRTWPATIPKRDGRVLEVNDQRIATELFASEDQKVRRQSYALKGKMPYVKEGGGFKANSCFLSGAPPSMADLAVYLGHVYDPFAALGSHNDVDRYAAVKSFPYRDDDRTKASKALERLIQKEQEQRVKLEAAGASLGSTLGQDSIAQFIWNEPAIPKLRMEAVLILSELGDGDFTRELLKRIAAYPGFAENEVRQAAIWGLGKAGLKAYEDLLPFIADEEENVALHAIGAFDADTPQPVIDRLIDLLLHGDPRTVPAASEVLQIIGSPEAIRALHDAYNQNEHARNQIIATLGRMTPETIRTELQGHDVLSALEPLLLWAPGANWLSSEKMNRNIAFLLRQDI